MRSKAGLVIVISIAIILIVTGYPRLAKSQLGSGLPLPKLFREKPTLLLSTNQVFQGEYLVLQVGPVREGQEVTVKSGVLAEPLKVFPYQGNILALLPIGYRVEPGDYAIEVALLQGDKQLFQLQEEIVVQEQQFTTQQLFVSEEQRSQRDETLWEQDRVYTTRARSQTSSQPLWEGRFVVPVVGRITTEFGLTRFINGVDSGRHSGLDIAAPLGTPIQAGNSGVVRLARSLYVTGNTVIIDHGLNLFSSYSHLQHIQVQEGQRVTKGEPIGTVGSTGFSTGPHLHWSLTIGSVLVNPSLLLTKDPLIME